MKKLILSELLLLFLATTFMTDALPPGWYQQNLPVNDQINDLFFIDSLNGWVVTNGDYNINDTSYVMHTTDGGNNWVVQEKNRENLTSIQFTDANTGYAAGGLNGTVAVTLYKTTNGGNNWLSLNNISGAVLEDIFFVNANTGWACDRTSGLGGLYRTTNGGLSWVQQLGASYTPYRMYFLNNDTGWFISNDNNLYKTINSGQNWTLPYSFGSENLVDIFFTNSLTGWIHGGPTGIYKSTNGGSNWDTVSNSLGYGQGKIFFKDAQHGWIGRSFSKILATTDGNTWGYQNSPSFQNISIQFVDTNKGWAGGSQLVHTTDGGGPITYVGIKSSTTFVTSFDLKQNYPNPFNPSTTIDFEVQKPSRISLKIFSIDGREVDELLDYEKFSAGYYYVDFNADDLSSGVYLYQMTGWTEDKKEIFIDTKKMILLK